VGVLRIGELADRTGVSPRSLRYYEEQGLLVSMRSAGGHRTYPETAVDRVIRIQELYAAGLNSAKISEILPCMRDADGGPNEQATPRLVQELLSERQRIDRQIAEMERTCCVLDDVIANAAGKRTGGSEPSPA
jgi:DNA-binding transcriptional MerR regulator